MTVRARQRLYSTLNPANLIPFVAARQSSNRGICHVILTSRSGDEAVSAPRLRASMPSSDGGHRYHYGHGRPQYFHDMEICYYQVGMAGMSHRCAICGVIRSRPADVYKGGQKSDWILTHSPHLAKTLTQYSRTNQQPITQLLQLYHPIKQPTNHTHRNARQIHRRLQLRLHPVHRLDRHLCGAVRCSSQ